MVKNKKEQEFQLIHESVQLSDRRIELNRELKGDNNGIEQVI